MIQILRHKIIIITALVLIFVIPMLLMPEREQNALEALLEQGELRVLSRNGPTTYYQDTDGLTGFEYELVKGFADSLGLPLRIIEESSLSLMLKKVNRGKADLAAAGLTVTDERKNEVRFSKAYLDVHQQLLYRNGTPKPKGIEDIIGKRIVVIKGSSHAERLALLKEDHPTLSWHEEADLEMLDLMELVHNGSFDHAVVDSNAYELNRAVYPMARVAFEISKPESLAWVFPNNDDNSLLELANRYLEQSIEQGRIDQLYDAFYGLSGNVDYGGALTFTTRIESRLPKWEKWLKEAAQENNLDWKLLAAVCYQESHWDPNARSPTGVRGLMMLTRATARELGVKDRTDPKESIFGGARYLRQQIDRIPEEVDESDRLWFALASYNVGYGHLLDARALTRRHGGDPNRWSDVSENLPLLAKRQYYSTTRYGYARGWEPVRYVRYIRSFYSILAWHDKSSYRQFTVGRNTMDSLTPQ